MSEEEDNSNDSDYVEEEGENLINVQEMVTQDGNNMAKNKEEDHDENEDNNEKEDNSMNIGEKNKQNENMGNMNIEKHHQQQVTQDVSVFADPKPVKNKNT